MIGVRETSLHRWALTVVVTAAAIFVALGGAIVGCKSSDARDIFVVPYDAGVDGSATEEAGPEVDPTLGGPCTDDAQCDDLIPCTFDRCDLTLSRCRNTPDDAQCQDGNYCNGRELCKLRQGCVPGPVITCGDGDNCTINRCVEETKSCESLPRDSDGDGDPDDHCAPHHDCDDTDPTVSSTRAEICGNFKDDNCDGQIDEQPCQIAANDVCATAFKVTAPGTFLLNTVAATKDYATTCSVSSPAAGHDIVLEIKVPEGGGSKDVLVRAETSSPPTDVAVAIEGVCGDSASQLSCGHVANALDARAIARSVAPGGVVYAIVTTQAESKVDVRVDMPDGSSPPTNEGCNAPLPVPLDQPFTVSLVTPSKDLTTACDAKTGELTYSFTLPEPRDVRIFASTLIGKGQPMVSMRAITCTDELRCRVGSSPPVFARGLPAGTHVFSVAGTSQIDANVVVKTYPASPIPANQVCSTAPEVQPNTTFAVDLSGLEDAIKNGCFSGGPTAAYQLSLVEPSDILVVARFPGSDNGGISLSNPSCGTADLLECGTGAGAPIRVSRRNVPAGSYRLVVADQQALNSELIALIRPTIPPVTVTSSDCSSPTVIPESGGYFVGDTATATANFNAGCDAPGQPTGGAKDQLLRLDLSQARRVIFDMMGSSMTTLLDVRSGGACPGIEVPNACNVGVSASRSFLDLTLQAGTYWVQVDGYAGASGPWSLDVRVLPP